jgi:hypothetical protein
MKQKMVAEIGNTVIQEAFSCLQIPGGALASHLLKGAFEKKAAEAREILFDMMSYGAHPGLTEDDAAYIIYRYLRAAQEGTARINLRLLAQVIAGKNMAETLTADKFLYYADIISSLKMEEIKLLGIMVRERKDSAYAAREALHRQFSEEKSQEIFQSLLRTGLVIFYQEVTVKENDDRKMFGKEYIGDLHTDYHLTSLMKDVCRLISFEEALQQETEHTARGTP